MNCRDENLKRATISMKYSEDEMRLRVMLWGSMDFINAMLYSISILTSSTN